MIFNHLTYTQYRFSFEGMMKIGLCIFDYMLDRSFSQLTCD